MRTTSGRDRDGALAVAPGAAATHAIVRRLQETPGVPCSCGTAYRVVQAADGSPASVHFVDIRVDSDRHFHRTFTEIYTCLEGSGFLELDGSVVSLARLWPFGSLSMTSTPDAGVWPRGIFACRPSTAI